MTGGEDGKDLVPKLVPFEQRLTTLSSWNLRQ